MNDFAEKVRAWVLELEQERMDEQRKKKAWVKKGNPYLFIKAVETVRLPTCPINCLFPKRRVDGAVGLPTPILMRIT